MEKCRGSGTSGLSQSPQPLLLPHFPLSGTISQHSVMFNVHKVPTRSLRCHPHQPSLPHCSSHECLPQAAASPSLPRSHKLLRRAVWGLPSHVPLAGWSRLAGSLSSQGRGLVGSRAPGGGSLGEVGAQCIDLSKQNRLGQAHPRYLWEYPEQLWVRLFS